MGDDDDRTLEIVFPVLSFNKLGNLELGFKSYVNGTELELGYQNPLNIFGADLSLYASLSNVTNPFFGINGFLAEGTVTLTKDMPLSSKLTLNIGGEFHGYSQIVPHETYFSKSTNKFDFSFGASLDLKSGNTELTGGFVTSLLPGTRSPAYESVKPMVVNLFVSGKTGPLTLDMEANKTFDVSPGRSLDHNPANVKLNLEYSISDKITLGTEANFDIYGSYVKKDFSLEVSYSTDILQIGTNIEIGSEYNEQITPQSIGLTFSVFPWGKDKTRVTYSPSYTFFYMPEEPLKERNESGSYYNFANTDLKARVKAMVLGSDYNIGTFAEKMLAELGVKDMMDGSLSLFDLLGSSEIYNRGESVGTTWENRDKINLVTPEVVMRIITKALKQEELSDYERSVCRNEAWFSATLLRYILPNSNAQTVGGVYASPVSYEDKTSHAITIFEYGGMWYYLDWGKMKPVMATKLGDAGDVIDQYHRDHNLTEKQIEEIKKNETINVFDPLKGVKTDPFESFKKKPGNILKENLLKPKLLKN